MDLTVRSGRQHVVVTVSGAIVPRTAPTLRECLLRVLNTAPPYVVLDISRVDGLDPAALPVIAEAHRGARLLGGSLCLVCSEPASLQLQEADVTPMIPRYGSVEQAVTAGRRQHAGRSRFGVGAGRRTSA